MKLVTTTDFFSKRFGEKNALKLIKDTGFDGFDYSMFNADLINRMDYFEYISELKSYADSIDIRCYQAHAPFPSDTDSETITCIIRSIKAAAIMGAEIIVIHPMRGEGRLYRECSDEIFEENIKFYNTLLPYARENDIIIALENMYMTDLRRGIKVSNVCSHSDEFVKYLDALNSDYITACLDIGHAALVSDCPANMIKKLGNRIGALHVHDVDYTNDNHTLPYLGKLNWNEICNALAKINYKGNFTFEADAFYSEYMDDDFIPKAAAFAHEVGRSLIKKITNYQITNGGSNDE